MGGWAHKRVHLGYGHKERVIRMMSCWLTLQWRSFLRLVEFLGDTSMKQKMRILFSILGIEEYKALHYFRFRISCQIVEYPAEDNQEDDFRHHLGYEWPRKSYHG